MDTTTTARPYFNTARRDGNSSLHIPSVTIRDEQERRRDQRPPPRSPTAYGSSPCQPPPPHARFPAGAAGTAHCPASACAIPAAEPERHATRARPGRQTDGEHVARLDRHR